MDPDAAPEANWDAVEKAAAAIRRVGQALAVRRPGDDVLEGVTEALNDTAQRIESGRVRVKLDDMLTRPHLREIYENRYHPLPLEVGEEIEFDPFSIGGGRLHPASLDVKFFKESESAVSGRAVVHPMFAGPPERTHGGVVALVLDELMGALNRMRGRQAYTGRLTVHYHAATPLGVPLRLRAWIENTSGRKIVQRAELHGPDGLCVRAEGLFILRADAPLAPQD